MASTITSTRQIVFSSFSFVLFFFFLFSVFFLVFPVLFFRFPLHVPILFVFFDYFLGANIFFRKRTVFFAIE